MRLAAQTRSRSHPAPNRVAELDSKTLSLPYSYKPPSGLVGASAEPGSGRTDALEGRTASW